MATVIKKISELEQLEELTSASNVIIEENGEAKRFSAASLGKVKTVNGVEPDENGNIEVEVGSSVQPDLSQNDSTQPDYVKNRQFYLKDPVSTELIPEQTVTFVEDGVMAAESPVNVDLVDGSTYIVTFDNEEYECIASPLGDGAYIGNASAFDLEATSFPFMYVSINGAYMWLAYDSATEHLLSLTGVVQDVVELNAKFLPSSIRLHVDDSDIHVSANDKDSWNGHVSNSDIHTTVTDKESWNNHVADSDIHVNAADKGNWNKSIVVQDHTITLPVSAYSPKIAYGNGKFISLPDTVNPDLAGYSNKGLCSEDCITWTEITLPISVNWDSIVYGNGKFIAVSNDKEIYSENSITWTEVAFPINGTSKLAYGNGKFVAFNISGADTNTAFYSEDGITWTETTLPVLNNYRCVVYGNGKFVATSVGNSVLCSENGITWTEHESMYPIDSYTVIYKNGKFMTVDGNRTVYSEDGITWIEATMSVELLDKTLINGGDKFIAVTDGDRKVVYSEDGITWAEATFPFSDISNFDFSYGDSKYVWLSHNKVAYSEDGIIWKNIVPRLKTIDGVDMTDTIKRILGFN